MRTSNSLLQKILFSASLTLLGGCGKDPEPTVYKIGSDTVTATAYATNGLGGPCGWNKLSVKKPNGKVTTYEDSWPDNYPLNSLTYTDENEKEITLRIISNLSPEEKAIFDYGQKEFEKYRSAIKEINEKKTAEEYRKGLEKAEKSL